MVTVTYYTDPACPWSWAAEPAVRKLMVEFGDGLGWTFVMAGLARDYGADEPAGAGRPADRQIREWLRAAAASGAPIDPWIWVEAPIATTYPACMAVKAASQQARDGGYGYLRRVREGLLCERRKLDHLEALVEEGRSAGLDVERFRIDLRSHGTTEAFAADLEQTQSFASGLESNEVERCSRAGGNAPIPTAVFRGEDGAERAVLGLEPYERYREAALGAGAGELRAPSPGAEELIARFGRVTSAEVELICELPGPRANAELFRLAEQWRVRPLWKMTGYIWEAA